MIRPPTKLKDHVDSWALVVAMVTTISAVGGIVTAHYNGIRSAVNESKNYTDQQGSDFRKCLDRIENKMDQMMDSEIRSATDMQWIKEKLSHDSTRKTANIPQAFSEAH